MPLLFQKYQGLRAGAPKMRESPFLGSQRFAGSHIARKNLLFSGSQRCAGSRMSLALIHGAFSGKGTPQTPLNARLIRNWRGVSPPNLPFLPCFICALRNGMHGGGGSS